MRAADPDLRSGVPTRADRSRLAQLELELSEIAQRGATMLEALARNNLLISDAAEYDRRRLLEDAARRLKQLEEDAGSDLAALRLLSEEHLNDLQRRAAALEARSETRARWTILLTVAAVLSAAALGAHFYRQQARALSTATLRLDALERQSAHGWRQAELAEAAVGRATSDALSAAARAERMVSVMAAADARRLDMRGGHAVPAAAGQAFLSRTRGLFITASRLPVLPTAEVYQVWFLTSRGPISLGFVAPDLHGRISATFDPPPDTVIGLWITREPAGGSLRPEGAVALATP